MFVLRKLLRNQDLVTTTTPRLFTLSTFFSHLTTLTYFDNTIANPTSSFKLEYPVISPKILQILDPLQLISFATLQLIPDATLD